MSYHVGEIGWDVDWELNQFIRFWITFRDKRIIGKIFTISEEWSDEWDKIMYSDVYEFWEYIYASARSDIEYNHL